MEEEKDAFYVVKKGDVIGIYKSLRDLIAEAGISVNFPLFRFTYLRNYVLAMLFFFTSLFLRRFFFAKNFKANLLVGLFVFLNQIIYIFQFWVCFTLTRYSILHSFKC